MKTISLPQRESILAAYDAGEETRAEIACRHNVSLGMVKKLIQQRKRIGSIGHLPNRAGRKPIILEHHRQLMVYVLRDHPDATLAGLRDYLGLKCSLPAIHHALADMKLTQKERYAALGIKTGRIKG